MHKDDPLAAAIGNVTINLAYLESLIDEMLMSWAGIVDYDITNIIMGHTDLSQKLTMLKGVGFLRKPSDEWFERLRAEVTTIEKLREKRNRAIHDLWSPGDDSRNWKRIRSGVFLKRLQSRQPLQLTTIERTPVDVDEVWALADEIARMTTTLMLLDDEIPEPC